MDGVVGSLYEEDLALVKKEDAVKTEPAETGGQADDADEGLESGDEDDVEFVMGDGGASSGGASLASGRAVPGSHNRTFLRDDGAAQEHTAIAMQKTVVDESKPSQYEMDIDQVEAKPWRNPGAKMSDWFNYGFNEETWRLYCRKQQAMREENKLQSRIEVVSNRGRNSRERSPLRRGDRRSPARDDRRGGGKRSRSRSRERSRSPGRGRERKRR